MVQESQKHWKHLETTITVLLSLFLIASSYPHGKAKCGEALSGLYGKFSSPNFPEKYPDNLKCNWSIKVAGGYYIDLEFTQFDVENYEHCSYDYVTVADSNNTVGKYCGKENKLDSNLPTKPIVLKTNSVSVQFVTDHSNEEVFHGFQAHFAAKDINECETNNGGCMHFCNNYIGGHYCSCKIGYRLDADKKSCIVQCKGNILREKTGVIQSPEYPNNYPPRADCAWNIAVEKGYSIVLDFEDFSVEDHPDYQCPYDWLRVELADKGFKTLCGKNKPARIESNTNWLFLMFHSDKDENWKGFRIRYHLQSVKCPTLQDPANGKIQGAKKFEFKEKITFSCNDGYDLVGPTQVECQSEGQWTAKPPICKIRSCGKPDIPTGGLIKGDQFTYLSTIIYECGILYDLVGDSTRLCEADGKWSGKAPRCKPICGRTKFASHQMQVCRGRIQDGSEANKGSHPWLAALWKGGNVICGGSLLNENWVLTAAHCVTNSRGHVLNTDLFKIGLGHHNIRENSTETQMIKVAAILKHPDFSYKTYNGDVALIRLDRSAKMTDYVRPVCLPTAKEEKRLFIGRRNAMAAGWGQTYFHAKRISKTLNEVCIPIARKADCVNAFDIKSNPKITELMLCAGKQGSNQNVCKGDSGGPLVAYDQTNKKWILGGVVSWGSPTSCGNNYEVFARVTKLMSWIKANAIFDLEDPFADGSSD